MTSTRLSRMRAFWLRPRSSPLDDWIGVVAWLLSRSVMAYVFAVQTRFIRADVVYYFTSIDGSAITSRDDLAHSLVEYPVPVVWIMQLLRTLSGPSEDVYVFLFALCLVALDALCCWLLWTRISRLSSVLWMLFIFLIGPLVWFRIDLIPAVCVLLALKELGRRPRFAGAAIAVGAATKLWPALLIVPMLGWHPAGRRRGIGFLATGLVIGGASLFTEGFARSASPLTWQSARGLQVESIWATPLMIARLGSGGDDWTVRLSQYNAYEIFGPSVDAWTSAATVAMVVLIVLVAVLGWLIVLGGLGLPGHSLRLAGADGRRRDRELAITLSTLAIVCGVIVANKTFSPQYMIWLAGPFAMLIATQLRSKDRRHAMIMLVLGLVAAALTQFVFPLNYAALVQSTDPGAVVTVVLAIRNLIMVVLTVYASTLALRAAWRVGLARREPGVIHEPGLAVRAPGSLEVAS
ncbi:MAG: hypothetical protein WAX29_06050 [Propionibacterium sp.]